MALSDIKIEKKQKLGSNFGGGWGLVNWIKQSQEDEEEKKKITLSDIKIEKPQTEPKEENKQVEQGNPFLELNNNIIEQYEKLNNMQKELQEKQQALQQAPDVLKPSLMATYEVKLTEYNDMFKQFNENIKQRDAMIQEQQQKRLDIERLQGSMGRPFKEPTWGEVITNSLKAGLASYQSSLLNIARLIQTGAVKATDKITDIFDKDWYDPENDFVLNYLTKLVEDSEKIATQSAEQAKAKNWLKQFLGTGLQAVPQILGSWFLGGAIPTMSALKSAGYAPKVAEFIDQAKRMIPFGIGAAGAHAREVEKEFEELGKEAPYFSTLFYGIVSGMAEMATELPVFTGVSKILKGNTKLINEGAKTFISKYGKGAYEIGKNIILQAAQEAEIEPIVNSAARAIGLEREKIIDLKQMGKAAYGGLAMAVIMGGIGSATAGVAKGTANVTERIMQSIEQKNIKKALEIINNEAGFVRIGSKGEGEGEGKKEEVTPKPTEEIKIPEKEVEKPPRVEPKPPEVTMPEKEELVTKPVEEEVAEKQPPKIEQKLPEIPKEPEIRLTKEEFTQEVEKFKQTVDKLIDGNIKEEKEDVQARIDKNNQEMKSIQEMLDRGTWFEGGKKILSEDAKRMEKRIKELKEINEDENKRLSEYIKRLEKNRERYIEEFKEEWKGFVVEQKFPEINTRIKEDIRPKVEEAIKQELPKIAPKMPDIAIPEATEYIMPKVEKIIQKELNLRAEIKPPDIPVIEQKIEKKIPEIVKEELPKLKIEPKVPEVEIKEEKIYYPTQEQNPYIEKELAGKPSGDIQYKVFVDGREKGKIYYSPKMEDIGAYSVSSDSILGKFKTKRFKTLKGARDFIVKSKEKYMKLGEVNLMTGERIVPKPKAPEITIPKEPWQMTKKEIKNWEIQVPEGGSSKSPSTVLNWNREEYETLLDLAKLDDKYRFNESLTGSGRKDVDPLLKNKILKNEPIKIYRVSDVGDIIPGSYVSESLDYVKKHQENIMQGKGKIYSKIVKPSELMSYGDPHEFIYIPENIESYHKPIIQQALSEGKPVPAEVLADYPELKAELKPPTKLEEKPEEVLEKVKEPEAKEEIPKAEVAKPEAIPEKTIEPKISEIPDIVYRGVGKPKEGLGISVTTDKKIAEEFAKGKEGKVEVYKIDPNVKLANFGDFIDIQQETLNESLKEKLTDAEIQKRTVSKLKKEGYDGIDFRSVPSKMFKYDTGWDAGFNIFANEREIFLFDDSKVFPITERPTEVTKPEAIPEKTIEPTIPEKVTKKVSPTMAKIDDLIVKTNRIKTDIEKTIKMMVDSHTKYLIETSGKGVDMGLIPTEEGGYTRYAVSQNPVWYQKLFKAKGRTPTKAEIREEAESQLREGLIEENIPPDSEFLRMEAQVEAWDTLLDTLKSIKEGLAEVEPTKEVVKIIENIKDVKPQKITQAKIQQVSGKLEKELNAQIMSQKEKKGLSNKEFEAIKVRITEKMSGQAKHKLTSKVPRYTISLEEKLEILKAINKVRPKRIGYQRVITKKTEDKIESLKNTYMKEVGMTIEDWHEILAKENLQRTITNPETGEKEIVYKEPKYINGREFITEKKGKEIIKRLNNKYYVLKAVNPYKKAVETNSFKEEGDFLKFVNTIQEKMDKGKHKDPKEWWSMRYAVMQHEKQTKQPMYRVWQTIIDTNSALKRKRHSVLEELRKIEGFKEIVGKPEELKKVEDLILSEIKWLENKPEKPTDIDERHTNIANKIKSILKDYEVKAMVARFIDKADRLQELPQYEEYKKDLIKARDIYETKGVEELIKFIHQKYNEGNTLGLIRNNGYLPDLMINHKIRMYEPPADSLSTTHIEVKNNIHYMPQEKNILQRLPAYMRQIDMLTEMRGLLQGLIQMYEDNYNAFDNPNRVLSSISDCIKEIKHWGIGDSFFDRLFARLYAQAVKVIIKPSPVLSFRNLLQPFANMTDKTTLFDPRNKKLNKDRVEYVDTYILQTEQMLAQFFMTNEKSLFEHIPVLKQLDQLISNINIYPLSDRINRLETFWAKINEVDRALESSKNLSELLNKINFHELDEIQQIYAIEEFALHGKEAFARYVARVETDNTQFKYAREERAPMEMGKTGRIMGNLMLFPRAYMERLGRAGKGMIRKGVSYRERLRHFKTIASMIIGGMIAMAIYKKVTGRTGGGYDIFDMLGYSIGGLQLAAVQQANETWILIIDALRGDERSLKLLPAALSQTGDMFIPFYRWFMDGVEAMTDKQQIDRLAMRKIIAMIDDEYKPSESYYDLERTAYEKWLHFFGGGSVDFTIKERKAKERKAIKEREEIHKKSSGLSASQQLDKILGKSSGLSASEQLNKILKR